MRFSAACIVAVSIVALEGCGGGSAGSSQSQGPIQSGSVGIAKVGYVGKVKPSLSVSASNVTVAGLSGAAFSYIDFYPAPTLDNSSLVYYQGNQTWRYDFGTQATTQITHAIAAGQASWAPSGSRLAVIEIFSSAITADLYTIGVDGANPVHVTGTNVVNQYPVYSPDGTRIAGRDANGDFVVMNANGTGSTVLDTQANVYSDLTSAWLNNSTLIYSRLSSGHYQLFTIPATGGTPTLFIGNTTGADNSDPTVSPDGTLVAYSSVVGQHSNVVVSSSTLPSIDVISPTNYSDTYPTFSPDNLHLAFHRIQDGATSGGAIYTSSMLGQQATAVVNDDEGFGQSYPSSFTRWSPFLKYQRFIGSGGSLGSSASGFLYGQVGDRFASFLSFTATTPSTASITPASPAGSSASLVFSVQADSISRVLYANGYYAADTVITPTSATNLVVSFSSKTGQVTTVAPLAISGGRTASPKPLIANGQATYSGKFSAVYDSKGKNLAPLGASQITLDTNTGSLVSWN